MNRIYHPYWKWEDYINGMWRKVSKAEEDILIPDIIKFTGDHNLYGKAMMEVICDWKYTMENNLTNQSINYRAFIGHCACCYKHGYPEYLVRRAWGLLNDKQRILANNEAEKAYKEWIRLQDREVLQRVGEKMLF